MYSIEIPYPQSTVASGAHKYFNQIAETLLEVELIERYSDEFLIDSKGKICFSTPTGITKLSCNFSERRKSQLSKYIQGRELKNHRKQPDSELKIRGWMPFIGFELAHDSRHQAKQSLAVPLFHHEDMLHQELRKYLNKAGRVIALTEGEASSLRLDVPVDIIPPYLTDSWFQRKKAIANPKSPDYLLWVGRADESKGVSKLLEFSRLLEKFSIRVIAVGPGTEKLPYPIFGLGILSEEDLIIQYDCSIGLIHTGKHESFSFAIAQSLARGKPVICSSENVASQTISSAPNGISSYNCGADILDFCNVAGTISSLDLINHAKVEFSKEVFNTRLERVFSELKRD